jgi:hypothetical protein
MLCIEAINHLNKFLMHYAREWTNVYGGNTFNK